MKNINLVLIRHGQSEWNKKNLFTGWTDVDLSENGIIEAKKAGQMLKQKSLAFDQGFTSALKRSIDTLDHLLKEMESKDIKIERSWRLNERHYGNLQGQNKHEMIEKYGEEQVHKWRRDYNTKPPALEKEQPIKDKKYYQDLKEFPLAESLKDTKNRVMPFWEKNILPLIKKGQSVIVAAHGNSLRALIKHLEDISDEDICSLEVSTGEPILYCLDNNGKVLNKEILKKNS